MIYAVRFLLLVLAMPFYLLCAVFFQPFGLVLGLCCLFFSVITCTSKREDTKQNMLMSAILIFAGPIYIFNSCKGLITKGELF